MSVVAVRFGDSARSDGGCSSVFVVRIGLACTRCGQVACIVVVVRGAGGVGDELSGRVDGVTGGGAVDIGAVGDALPVSK